MGRPRKNPSNQQPSSLENENESSQSSTASETTTKERKRRTTTTETLFGEIKANVEGEPTDKASEIAELKDRYLSGEQPTDRPERERGKEVKKEKERKGKKEREEEAARLETFSASLGMLARVASQLLCSALPDPEPPTDLEIQILNDSLSSVAQKHFDKLLDYDAELALTIAVAAIVIPRLKRKKKPVAEVLNMAEASKAVKDLPVTEVQIEKVPDATQSNT